MVEVAAEAGLTFKHENGASEEKLMPETFGSGVAWIDYDIKNAPYCGFQRKGYRMYCDPQQFDGVPDLLFRNNRNGTFTDVAYEACVGFDPHGKSMAGMGTEIADYDADGEPDIFMTAFSRKYNTLFRNQSNLLFEDVTIAAGLESGFLTLAFGTKLFDFDNDGDLDVVVADCGGPPLLLRNDGGSRNQWLGIRARGAQSNRLGLGAKVRVTFGGRTLVREIHTSGSYLSSSDPRLIFGLGSETKAERVEIEWPSGKKQTLEHVPARQNLLLEESEAR